MITLFISTCQNHKQSSVLLENITTANFKRIQPMPNQPIKLQNVEYEMLLELAKKSKMKPDQYLSKLINKEHNSKRQ
jgi:hypothetical protein